MLLKNKTERKISHNKKMMISKLERDDVKS